MENFIRDFEFEFDNEPQPIGSYSHIAQQNLETQLKFVDIISKKRRCKPRKSKYDVFNNEEATSDNQNNQNEYSAMFQALHNPCILHQIFAHLPNFDLKRCRLTCKTWDIESYRVLRKTSKIVLNSSSKIVVFYLDNLERQKLCCKNVELVKVNLSTPSIEIFFRMFGTQIERLEIKDSKLQTPEVLINILRHKAPNIQELALHGELPHDTLSSKDFQFGDALLKLHTLDLQLQDKEEDVIQQFLIALFLAASNVKKIYSKTNRWKSAQDRKNDKQKFHRLLWETLIGEFPDQEKQIPYSPFLRQLSHVDIDFTPTSNDQIKQLQLKKYPLKYLSIEVLPSISIHSVLSLLITLRKTLVKLKLGFPTWRQISEFPMSVGLDNLTSLTLDWFMGGLGFVSRLPKLNTLKLIQVDTNNGFRDSKIFTHGHENVKRLEIHQPADYSILPETVETISIIFPKITRLAIGKLSDDSLRSVFSKFPELEQLFIIDGLYTDAGLSGISIPKCDSCHSPHLIDLCKGMYDEIFVNRQRKYPYIGDLQNLIKLEIRSPSLTNFSINHGLTSCTALRSLTLWSHNFTSRSLKRLIDDCNLDYLETTHKSVTKTEALDAIQKMKGKNFILNGHSAPGDHSILIRQWLTWFPNDNLPITNPPKSHRSRRKVKT